MTVIQFLLALGLALLLNAGLRFQWLVRPLALVPWAMPSVIVAILWKLIYQPDAGILNAILRDLRIIDSNIDWLGSFTLALPAVIVVGVWAGMPQTTVALLAGLQNTPAELHEAAAIDGAGTWERFKNVTWPAIKPVVVAITSLDFVWNFNSFGLVYVLTEGGPGGRTLLPMLFAYQRAFGNGEFGYAAALGNAMVIVIMAIMVCLPPAADAGGERDHAHLRPRPDRPVRRARRLRGLPRLPAAVAVLHRVQVPVRADQDRADAVPDQLDAGQLRHRARGRTSCRRRCSTP